MSWTMEGGQACPQQTCRPQRTGPGRGDAPAVGSMWFEAGTSDTQERLVVSWELGGASWPGGGLLRGSAPLCVGVMALFPVLLKVAIREGSQRAQRWTGWEANPTSHQASDSEPQFLQLSSGANINLYGLPAGARP